MEEDFAFLQAYRAAHDPSLRTAVSGLSDLGFAAAPRLKTPTTIIDKLVRERTRLSAMQDIAGVRVVVDGTLNEQDAAVLAIRHRFGGTVIDRRKAPSHGYRAVHVIVVIGDFRVEIQVRTRLQNLWAQVVERLGDLVGRGIRYGQLPEEPATRSAVEAVLDMADAIAHHEALLARVERVLSQIDALHRAKVTDAGELEGAQREMGDLKEQLDEHEESMRAILELVVARFERDMPS